VIGIAVRGRDHRFRKDLVTPLIAAIGGKPTSRALFHDQQQQVLYGDFINALSGSRDCRRHLLFVVLPITRWSTARGKRRGRPTTKNAHRVPERDPIGAKRCAFCAQPQSA